MKTAFLDTPIEFLKGIGPQRGDTLKQELQIFTFYDLLTLYPFRYIDRSKIWTIREIQPDLPYVQLKGTITKTELIGTGRQTRFVARLEDNTGTIELVWFQGARWMQNRIKLNTEYLVLGKVTEFKGRHNMAHPELDIYDAERVKIQSALQPVYPSTEKLKAKGLDSKGISKLQEHLYELLDNKIEETLPGDIIREYQLISREAALKEVHFPSHSDNLKKGLYRLKFEELLLIQLKLLQSKNHRQQKESGFVFEKVGNRFYDFYHNYLPFELTNAQKRVIREIRTDTGSGKQMNRLLQGDVGSGKTIVAMMSMLLAIDNGYQACIMAPTEILAQQHYETMQPLFEKVKVTCALLTGSTKSKEKKSILSALSAGTIDVIIGTHALIEDAVQFKNLGFSIIDEQHRFGVAQRAKLRNKNTKAPHVLVMTATPIPRTLAMTLYGDLDTSVIDELPPGRKPIKTVHYTDEKRLKLFGFMKEQIKLGRQIYVVFPLIEESEKLDLKNLMEGFDSIEREFPMPDYQISIMHGKLSPEKKEFEMQRFIKGQTQIMVSTTVIEVGVNVPNASVMVIENAERFGLSQLHQLRGRVGRGADQSYCILMTSHKLSHDARLRMDTMVRTNDGFEIAEVDLKLRGPGDIEGTQQSGIANLKIADLAKDQQILAMARNAAQEILANDPELENTESQLLKQTLSAQNKSRKSWSSVA